MREKPSIKASEQAIKPMLDALQASISSTQQGMQTSMQAWGMVGEYMTDVMQRTILYWDVMRQRSEQYYAQKAQAVPHVLSFESELILDARTFEKPVNYGLVRVIPPKGIVIDPEKRPFVVVDPRAGHGPGIGGFKADSEIGVAMRAGHPCYFVGFSPDPMPGQTIEDIIYAEAAFLEKVIELHPDADGKPCVIGNCQAGWAVMLVAAIRPELFGPIIVAGAPMSYWAGVEGENPMRYTGGLAGGSWMTALAGDLGDGKFDGGMLVENFEKLNPSNTLWTKSYNLWAKIDTEGPRYLEFEKWWGAHVNLNAEEIQWIVDQLFVGNHLATAEIVTGAGDRVDLRSIKSPIVCFCSKGDNITPPQQALGWITDLYATDNDIRACEQTIVYAVHETVGHLGIFVSGGIAKKEHQEFASNIDLIDVLPPGLYEAVMIPKTDAEANQDMIVGDWIVRFEPRTLDDVRAIVQPAPENERRFAAVKRVSEINLSLYRTLLQPIVKASINEQTTEWKHKLSTAELPFALFSDKNPFMPQLAALAEQVREQRRKVSPDNPLLQLQSAMSDSIIGALDNYRDLRDAQQERIFLSIYDSPLLQAMLGLSATDDTPRRRPGCEPERLAYVEQRIAEIKAGIATGGLREAAIRSLVYIGMAGPGVDERAFNVLAAIRAENDGMTLQEFKNTLREQFFCLRLDQEAALAALPQMLPADKAARSKVLDIIRKCADAAGKATGARATRLAEIEKIFGASEGEEAPARAPRTLRKAS
jgi:pimeloyl-ACP methyl ester carboxylesterase